MHSGIDEEIPDTNEALVSVGVDLVVVVDLVGDQLVHFAALELDLLLVELVLSRRRAHLVAADARLLLPSLLVVELAQVLSDRLPVVLLG